jgi:hypothetical protein
MSDDKTPATLPAALQTTQHSAPHSAPPAQAAAPQVIVYQTGFLTRALTWIGWTGFAICSLIAIGQWISLYDYFDNSQGITEQYVQGAKFGSDKVAVLSIEGVIMEGDGFVKRQIDRIREDDSVKAVVVRVDSPGGTVTGSDYIYHHLAKLRKDRDIPVVVSMGSIAASGGYYVSMAVRSSRPPPRSSRTARRSRRSIVEVRASIRRRSCEPARPWISCWSSAVDSR